MADDSAASQSPIEWTPGQTIGPRYVIRRILGKGGMGVVAIADDLLLRKPVALKALLPHKLKEEESLQLFFKEVSLAHQVTHPNIVRIYDLGEHQGVFFFSMEYLKGEPLDKLLERHPQGLPVSVVRDLALRICEGLTAAHKSGIVHRDLKPSNILLVDPPRHVVILDFGISGTSGSQQESSQASGEGPQNDWNVTSAGTGTPVYMAPEQWQKKPTGPATDLYALGSILFQCLTGRTPFQAETLIEYVYCHMTEPAPSVRSVAPQVPKSLERAIAQCLEKKPEDRPATAKELADQIAPPRLLQRVVELSLRALITGLVLAVLGFAVYKFGEAAIIQEMKPFLHALASATARRIDTTDLDAIHSTNDMDRPEYQRVHRLLVDATRDYPSVRYIYTTRKLEGATRWEAVVDRDAFSKDYDGNGVPDEAPNKGLPGTLWDSSDYPKWNAALKTHVTTTDDRFIYNPVWGNLLSAYAPLGDTSGPGAYVLGVDVNHQRLLHFRNGIIVIMSLIWLATLFVPQLVTRWIVNRYGKRTEATESQLRDLSQ